MGGGKVSGSFLFFFCSVFPRFISRLCFAIILGFLAKRAGGGGKEGVVLFFPVCGEGRVGNARGRMRRSEKIRDEWEIANLENQSRGS